MMSKSWLGSIESIVLDWHEGLFIETLASGAGLVQTVHGPMLDNGPTGVYFDAICCLCEWAYDSGPNGGGTVEGHPLLPSKLDVSYGYRTPDVEEMLQWARKHRACGSHLDAVQAFRREKLKERSDGGAAGVR
jgi:hypothetical protein